MIPSYVIGIVVAALGGAGVGLERQWSGHAEGPSGRFAGIRTFTMLGAVAGVSGWLWTIGASVFAVLLLAGAVAITAGAYVAASRQEIEGTTEVAALVVLAAGVLAGMGHVRLASGITAIEILLLVEKSRLHALVRRIDDAELRAGVRFAVMALVVLPLLPAGPYGPWGGFRPRELWILVLFFSGLSFAGHLLRNVVGPGRGYFVSGVAGGLVSSTSVTFTFAGLSRKEPSAARALAFGAVGANAVLFPRVVVAALVLNARVVPDLLPYLMAPAAVAAVAAVLGMRERVVDQEPNASSATRNPLQLGAALQMAAVFQLVILLVNVARESFGDAGILTSAAVLGLTDVDALTVSMTRGVGGTIAPETAALAIAVGVLANTALKMCLAVLLGAAVFRRVVAGVLLLMAVAAAISIALLV